AMPTGRALDEPTRSGVDVVAQPNAKRSLTWYCRFGSDWLRRCVNRRLVGRLGLIGLGCNISACGRNCISGGVFLSASTADAIGSPRRRRLHQRSTRSGAIRHWILVVAPFPLSATTSIPIPNHSVDNWLPGSSRSLARRREVGLRAGH